MVVITKTFFCDENISLKRSFEIESFNCFSYEIIFVAEICFSNDMSSLQKDGYFVAKNISHANNYLWQ